MSFADDQMPEHEPAIKTIEVIKNEKKTSAQLFQCNLIANFDSNESRFEKLTKK